MSAWIPALDLWDEGLERFENAFLSAVDDPVQLRSGGTANSSAHWSASGAVTDYISSLLGENRHRSPHVQSFSDFRTVVFLPPEYPVLDTAQFLATFARLVPADAGTHRQPGDRTGYLLSRVGLRPGWPHPVMIHHRQLRPAWWWWPTEATWRWSTETSLQLNIWPPGEIDSIPGAWPMPPLGAGRKDHALPSMSWR